MATIQEIVDDLLEEYSRGGRKMLAALREIRKLADQQDMIIKHLALRPTRLIHLEVAPADADLSDA